jgi:hypothetical protein
MPSKLGGVKKVREGSNELVNENNPPQLVEVLTQLAELVRNEVHEGHYRPDQELYYSYKVSREDFSINDQGFVHHQGAETYLTQASWDRAVNSIFEGIKDAAPYSAALNLLTESYPNDQRVSVHLDTLVRHIARQYLIRLSGADPSAIQSLISTFLSDLDGVPTNFSGRVNIAGVIAAFPLEIQVPAAKIVLRPITPEDLEESIPSYALSFNRSLSNRLHIPPTIMEITALLVEGSEMQRIVERMIAILRLFRVQSVFYQSYSLGTSSLVRFGGGTLFSGGADIDLEKSSLSREESSRFTAFCSRLYDKVPADFFWAEPHVVDYRVIAYQRYCDALLHNGTTERRIANAVMGLEAILLGESESAEVTYKLKLRTAKLASFLGYDPLAVAAAVNDGYGIRSDFVHGSGISPKDRRRIDKAHTGMAQLARKLLDYLRVTLLATLTSAFEKKDLTRLLDEAMLDMSSKPRLQEGLQDTRAILLY